MSGPARSVFDTRYDQVFPRLEPVELERLRRFGEARSYAAGAYLARTGEVSPGMLVPGGVHGRGRDPGRHRGRGYSLSARENCASRIRKRRTA